MGLGVVVVDDTGRPCCGCAGADGRGGCFFVVDDDEEVVVVVGVTTTDFFGLTTKAVVLPATAVVVETGVFKTAAEAGCFLTTAADAAAGVDGGTAAADGFFLAYGLYRGMMNKTQSKYLTRDLILFSGWV